MLPLALVLRWDGTTWVYSDDVHDVVDEPFVMGVPEMIDKLRQAEGIALHPRPPFKLLFSLEDFPDAHHLELGTEDSGGVWVKSHAFEMAGWCCAHIHDYFKPLPRHLHAKAEHLA